MSTPSSPWLQTQITKISHETQVLQSCKINKATTSIMSCDVNKTKINILYFYIKKQSVLQLLFSLLFIISIITIEGFLRKNIAAVSFFQDCAIHSYT